MSEPSRLQPLFRWPGGKRWLVSTLLGTAPSQFGRYFEPFFGGGALFFALAPSRAVISDANSELMSAYAEVRKHPAELEELLRGFPRDRAGYLQVRASTPDEPTQRAARLIYLTTLAFNGIYRVNREGRFNVPYGGREYKALGDPGRLTAHAAVLQTAEIRTGDFGAAVEDAVEGDFAYLDPPYTVRHDNNGFLRYNERIFSMRDQERLSLVARNLASRGVSVVVSNAAHPSVIALYPSFRIIRVRRASAMSADPSKRGPIEEILITNVG